MHLIQFTKSISFLPEYIFHPAAAMSSSRPLQQERPVLASKFQPRGVLPLLTRQSERKPAFLWEPHRSLLPVRASLFRPAWHLQVAATMALKLRALHCSMVAELAWLTVYRPALHFRAAAMQALRQPGLTRRVSQHQAEVTTVALLPDLRLEILLALRQALVLPLPAVRIAAS